MPEVQETLLGVAPVYEIGDPLERCYTPDPLAEAIVRALGYPGTLVIEPSAGGGAFVRAIRLVHGPGIWVHGLDLDPAAPARVLCDSWTVGSWLDHADQLESPGLIVGNPPFAPSMDHVLAALRKRCRVAFILPLAYQGVGRWVRFMAEHPPAVIRPIEGRPWSVCREVAVYEWWPWGNDGPTRTIPLANWKR